MQKVLLFLSFIFSFFMSISQSFSGYGGSIKDNTSKNFYSLTVSGLPSTMDSKFGIMGVNVNIKHQFDADLTIFVIAPNNTVIELSSGNGGNGKNYDDCTFTNNSSTKIKNGKAPFNGSYKPEGSLGVLNNGQNPNGVWRLLIIDTKANKDTGLLVNWSVIFTNAPSKIEPFVNSNLPLLLINTHGKTIIDEPRIWSELQIINNVGGLNTLADSSKSFKYGITIENRGSTSQSFPKKPMGFTTVLKNLADTNVSLLGLPEEHDWVLNATYNDKSLMRDVLTYEMARRTGRYATRHRYCELFINGNYEGIYVLMEKVKRDKNRVDISKLEPKDSVGNPLTGGYILKIDKTTGNNNGGFTANGVYYQYDYPNGDDMVPQQRNYIQSQLAKFESALNASNFQDPTNGFRQYADVSTFIDYSIMNEISKNVDGYRLSTYLFKERDSKGGKFKMGPIWDFNLAWNNADYNNSSSPIGWEIDLSSGLPFWWKKFRQDTAYVKSFYCRWNQLRQSTLSLYSINNFIDSNYRYLEEASYRNFDRWPVMGIYIWPNPSPLSYSMKEEVDSLKSWIQKRCEWIDAEVGVNCNKVNTCKPKVVVFADKNVICKNQSTRLFADGLGMSYKWSPSTGLNKTTGREVIANPSSTTTYKVVMITKGGCSDSTYITIKVSPLPNKTITGNTSFCEGGSTTLTAASGSKFYQWSPATGLDNTSGKTVVAKPTFNIVYKVNFTDSFGCKDSNTILIKVNKNPLVKISSGKDTLCQYDSTLLSATGALSYKWLANAGLKESNTSSVKVSSKSLTYQVVGTSDLGCMDTSAISISSFPIAKIRIEQTVSLICYGESATLSAKDGSSYLWLSTAGFDGTAATTVQVNPKFKTKYTLTGRNKYGCKDTVSSLLDVLPQMVLKVSGDSVLCQGESTPLEAVGNYNFEWSPAIGLNKTTGSNVLATPLQTTTYKLVATANQRCKDSISISIKVNPKPKLSLTVLKDTIEAGKQTVVYVAGAKNYVWQPQTWVKAEGDSFIVNPPSTTAYSITGTDTLGCSSDTNFTLHVKEKVGLNNISRSGIFAIYPNPASEFVMVESEIPVQITLSSSTGQELMQLNHDRLYALKIPMNELAAGVYFITLKADNKSTTFRLLKN